MPASNTLTHSSPAGRRAAIQVVGGRPQLEPNSVAQLGGGGTRVRDDEHFLDVDAFGEIVVVDEVTGDKSGDEGGE